MRTITPSTALKHIESGELDPVYLVLGDDAVEKAEIVDAFEQVVDQGLRAFNVDRFLGGDGSLGQAIEAARTLPMVSARRIVIVTRIEDAIAPKRESRNFAADIEAFETYLDNPQAHVALVLTASNLDKRRRITMRLMKIATVVACGVIENLADAERWVRRQVAEDGSSIDPLAVRLLVAHAGPDLTRLRGDVSRLLLFTAGQSSVTVADVRETVGPAVAHDDWAVARAIERGQAAQALRELALVVEAGAVPYMVLGQLAWVVRTKLRSDRLSYAVEALFRTDIDLKTSAGDHRVLLERLVLELCGVSLASPEC